MLVQVAVKCLEVGLRALAWYEAQLHQLACRVIDEDQQRAGIGAVFEPPMIAAVHLHQFAVRLTSETRLMEGAALLTRKPESGLDLPLADTLTANVDAVTLIQSLGCERRSEVSIALPDQLDRVLADTCLKLVVGDSSTGPMDQSASGAIAVTPQQPVHLAIADRKTVAAEATLRRPARTSVNTSMRCRSFALIATKPMPLEHFNLAER